MWVKSLIRKGLAPSKHFWNKVNVERAGLAAVLSQRQYSSPGIQKSSKSFTPVYDVSLWQYLTEDVTTHGNRTAVECGVTGKKYTFTEIVELSERLAAALHRKGINKGDVVCSYLPNCPETLLILMACSRIGAILSTASTSLTADELSRQLVLSEAKVIFFKDRGHQIVKEAVDKTKSEILTIGTEDNMELMLKEDVGVLPHASIEPVSDVAVLPFSSGTTGPPKGVMLTHSNLINNVNQRKCSGEVHFVENNEHFQTTVLGILPMYHSYGLSVILLGSMKFGDRIITMPSFQPDSFVKVIQNNKFHVLFLAPPLIQYIVAEPRLTSKHFSEVFQMCCGGAPLGKTLAENIIKKTSNPSLRLSEGYGLTETSPVTHMDHRKLGSIGILIPGTEAKIIDSTTSELLGAYGQGELCIRGPQVMKGYFNNPEADKSTLIGGWLHTGDIGYYDDEGFYFITGRTKELIKVKGLQVSPSELEDLLRKHPGIADVGIIGVPDERAGEVPRAFIVKKDANLTEKQVTDFLHPQISKHKYLAGGVTFIDAIPKNPTGKILRRVLKEKYV